MIERLTVLAFLVLAAASQGDLPVDAIVSKHLEACGGAPRLRQLSTVRQTGTLTLQGLSKQASGPCLFEEVRPNLSRTEFKLDGTVVIRAFDGETAWRWSPDQGSPTILSAAESEGMTSNEFDTPFLDYAVRGIEIELVGSSETDGFSAYKLVIVLKNGATRFSYLDKRTFLEGRRDYLRDGRVHAVQYFKKHRSFGGVIRPTVLETRKEGADSSQSVIVWDSIEFNVPLAADRFRMPNATR